MKKIYFWTILTIITALTVLLAMKYVSDYTAHKRNEAFLVENTRKRPDSGGIDVLRRQGNGPLPKAHKAERGAGQAAGGQ